MDKITQFRNVYFFLSNFYPSPVYYDGSKYSTVEHAYQAAKTTDQHARVGIRNLPNPGDAKRMGRRVVCRLDWNEVKLDVMYDLVKQKFSSDEVLQARLLATYDTELIEGNYWHDTFWGVDLRTGKGENHLGKILMWVREELKNLRDTFSS